MFGSQNTTEFFKKKTQYMKITILQAALSFGLIFRGSIGLQNFSFSTRKALNLPSFYARYKKYFSSFDGKIRKKLELIKILRTAFWFNIIFINSIEPCISASHKTIALNTAHVLVQNM